MTDTIKALVVTAEPLNSSIVKLLIQPNKDFKHLPGEYINIGLNREDLYPFSIANLPQSNGLIELHIRNIPENDVIQQIFDIKPFESLYIEGPIKQYQLKADVNQSIIFVAGGTGFAPMKVLLDQLIQQDHTGIIEFYWGGQIFSDLYQHSQLMELCKTQQNFNYIPVLSNQQWNGRTGFVHHAVLEDHPNMINDRVYLCGPWVMQQTAKQEFLQANLPDNRFN